MINLLLLFVPLAIVLEHVAPEHHLLVFVASGLAILPLAVWMGLATEHLAERQQGPPCQKPGQRFALREKAIDGDHQNSRRNKAAQMQHE